MASKVALVKAAMLKAKLDIVMPLLKELQGVADSDDALWQIAEYIRTGHYANAHREVMEFLRKQTGEQ